VRRVTEHVDVEEFCDIVMTGEAVFLLETRPNGRALLDNDSAFVRKRLAGALDKPCASVFYL
jgi:hypothetical protein